MSSRWKITASVCLVLFWTSLKVTTRADNDCDFTKSYMCADGKTCVPKMYLCNNNTDCPGGDDETDCGKLTVTQFSL